MKFSEFLEIQNFGLNIDSGIFLITIFFTILQAVALIKQSLKILAKKSGESISFSFFSYYGFSAIAIGIFGFQAKTLSLAINGWLLGILALTIIFNVLRFRKIPKREKIIGLTISPIAIPAMIFMPNKNLLFLILGAVVLMALFMQVRELYLSKSSGAFHPAQAIVSTFSVSFWLIYAFMVNIWPLQIINSIALLLWISCLIIYLIKRSIEESV